MAETLQIEQRLRDAGYAQLPEVLRSGGDFDFQGDTVEQVVEEALRYLRHQQTVELAGATILAAIGEQAVKAQAFDAVLQLVRRGR
ncbi:MAG: hypothetical protein Q8K58_01055 [Acidimicrobiales bacterium]|nr:hypothetical protein [Acidimicrobiales bacterium]